MKLSIKSGNNLFLKHSPVFVAPGYFNRYFTVQKDYLLTNNKLMTILEKCKYMDRVHTEYNSNIIDPQVIGTRVRPILRGEEPLNIFDDWAQTEWLKAMKHWGRAQKKFNQVPYMGITIKGSEFRHGWQYAYMEPNTQYFESVKFAIMENIRLGGHNFMGHFMLNISCGYDVLISLGQDEETLRLINESTHDLLSSIEDEEDNDKVMAFVKRSKNKLEKIKYQ